MKGLGEFLTVAIILTFGMVAFSQCSSCQCVENCMRYARNCKPEDKSCYQIAEKCTDSCKSSGLITVSK